MTDYEPVDCHEIMKPVARKEHQCDACFSPIGKGSVYERHTYLLGGKWRTWRQCCYCAEMTSDVFACSFLENIHVEVFEHDETYEHPLLRAYVERYIQHLERRAERYPDLMDKVSELREALEYEATND